MPSLIRVPVLIAPTASGKKELVLRLLEQFPDLTVIYADSRKLYTELEIGTAKPPRDLRGTRILGVDLLRVDERASAAAYAHQARGWLEERLSQKRRILVVSGTPLYFIALHRGLFPAPQPRKELRRFLERAVQRKGSVWAWLQWVDPQRAHRVHPHDHVRTQRALEVFFQTQAPMSLLQRIHPFQPLFTPVFAGILRPYPELRERIARRVQDMVRDGLFEEVETLLQRYPVDAPGWMTTGYRELIPYFLGKISRDQAIRDVIRRTWVYARQQLRFFRRWYPQIPWMSFEEAYDRLEQVLRAWTP